MQFQPKTEDEVSNLLEPGEADYEVRAASEEMSSSGNEMIKLVLRVWDSKGRERQIFDYLLDAMPHKLRHFAYSCGLGHMYEAGKLGADNCIGKGGRCLLRIGQDRERKYPPKNEIVDYVVADRTKETKGYDKAKSTSAPRVGEAALQHGRERIGDKQPTGPEVFAENGAVPADDIPF